MRYVNKDEIKSILQEFGCSFKTNSRSFILTCPRCNKAKKLYIRQTDGVFCCWVCRQVDGFQGGPEKVLRELTNLSKNEICRRIYGEELYSSNDSYIHFRPEDFIDDEDELELFREPILAPIKYTPDILPITHDFCKDGVNYLNSRGISLELACKYELAYSPAQRRVIFPVKSKNELYGWQGRYVGAESFYDEETDSVIEINKAMTSLGLKKDKTLMFKDNLYKSGHCVLCEGPIDAIKADLCGGNVATMGKSVSKTQLDIVRNSGASKVYLALDPDAASEIRRIKDYFKDIDVYDMRPANTDLGDMTLQEVKNLFDSSEKINNNKIIVYIKNFYEAK